MSLPSSSLRHHLLHRRTVFSFPPSSTPRRFLLPHQRRRASALVLMSSSTSILPYPSLAAFEETHHLPVRQPKIRRLPPQLLVVTHLLQYPYRIVVWCYLGRLCLGGLVLGLGGVGGFGWCQTFEQNKKKTLKSEPSTLPFAQLLLTLRNPNPSLPVALPSLQSDYQKNNIASTAGAVAWRAGYSHPFSLLLATLFFLLPSHLAWSSVVVRSP
ncbi:hypothetical protein PIB30_050601 [Stylosanthes scabra]|uniref:Uncharacterized protein n=1 Tax=Stylosanthes scabra TaxID=79078 RepID=A0ABU6WHH3_9FABA|nr:hypothetical protein [Stylosanthes scabra]